MISQNRNLAQKMALFIGVAFTGTAFAQTSAPMLEETTVIASRIEMPLRQIGASVSVLTEDELEDLSFPALADALRTLPSVSVAQSGGLGKSTSVSIRGEEGFRTLLLIDGINVSDVSAVQAMPLFGHVLNSQYGRVEVLRGPQGMMYGADAGGVISISSKRSDQPFEADFGAEAGGFDTRRLNGNLRGTVNRVSYSLTGSRLSSDGFNALKADPAADDDGYENTSFHGVAEAALTANSSVEMVLRNVTSESQYDGMDASDYREEYEQRAGKIGWHYDTEKQGHKLAYLYSNTDRKDIVWSSEFEGNIKQWQYVGNYRFAEDLGLVFGADQRTDSYTSTYTPDEFEREQAGVFVEGQVGFGDRFFYTAGVRYDDNQDFGEHTSYRLTMAYLLPVSMGELKLKGSYGTGFRAPSLYEVGHNRSLAGYSLPGLREEKSAGYELGVEWRFTEASFVELVWFHSEIEDEIYWLSLGGFTGGYFQVAGETLSQGIDVNGAVEVFDSLVISANYTYNDTELNENTTLVGAMPGEQRPRRPKHKYNLSVAYDWWQDRVRLAAFYRNSRDTIDYVYGVGPVPLEDHDVLDLTASWRIVDELEAYLRWENALDEDYQEVAGYNTAGSAAYAGIRLRF